MSSLSRPGIGPAAALAALTAIWGYNWVVIKFALADSPPLTFSALRAVLSALALFAVVVVLRRPLRPMRAKAIFTLGALQTTGFVGCAALAVEFGTAGKSAVLAYTMPFWTLMLAGLFLGERMRGAQWFAVVLAACGLVGVLNPFDAGFGIADSLFALGAAWCWAISNIVVKRLQLKGDELFSVSAWQMLFGGLGLSVLAMAIDTEPVRWSVPFVAALGYNVVFATALAWLLWLFALNRLSAGATGLATLGAPPVALAAAWLQLGEIPTRAEAIGMVLIIGALACLTLAGWQTLSRSTAAS